MFSVKPFATTPFSTGAVLPAAVEQQNGALLGVGSFSQDTLSSGGPVVNGAVVVGVFATTAVGTVDVQVSGSADVNVNVVGIEANGAVGTVSVPIDESVTLTGIEATGAVGTVAVAADANALATGVQGSGQTGQITVALPVEVTLTGVQGLGQVVEEPHEFNVKYATYPSANTFDIVHPQGFLTFGNTLALGILEDGSGVVIRGQWTGNNTGAGRITFSLSTPWDLSTATYGTDFDTSSSTGAGGTGGISVIRGAAANPLTSARAYLPNVSTRQVYAVTQSSASGPFNTSSQTATSLTGIFSKPVNDLSDSTSIFVSDFNANIYEYSGGSFSASSSYTYANKSFSTGFTSSAGGISFDNFGTRLYFVRLGIVYQYALSTPWDLSTAQSTPQESPKLNGVGATPGGLFNIDGFQTEQISWKPDGTQFFCSFGNAKAFRSTIAPTTATVTVEQGVGVFVTGVSAAADVGTAAVIQGAEALVTGVQANANVGAAIVDTTGSVNAFVTGVQTGSKTFIVTVVYDGYGNIFAIDGVNKPTLSFLRGAVYTFDQSAATNGGHQLAFKDGTGASYTVGVVNTGTPGQAGAQTVITVAANAPDDLRYYCVAHGNYMGNTIAVGSLANTIGNVAVFGTANVAPIGVAASALLNNVTIASEGNISFDVTGAQGTGEIGQVGASGTVDVPLTGVSGTGEAGQVEATLDAIAFVQGLSTAGNVGQVEVGATNVEVTGVSALGEIGSVEVTGTCVFDVQGLAAQGQVGVAQAITAAFVTATGVDATASIGATEVLTSAIILTGGVESIGEVGVTAVSGDANVFAFGTQALGTIGVVAAGNVINVGVTGVQAVGFVGTINVTAAGSISVNVQGVTAIGQVGSLSTTGWSDIVVTQDPNWLPIAA